MLKLLLVISTLIGCTLGAAVLPQLEGRIVGGVSTTISGSPWQVSIQENGTHYCGGSIYSERIIITAAHCLESYSMSDLKIRAGSSNWNSGGVLHTIDAIRIHQNYDIYNIINDIAVIRLSEPLTYSSTIQNISLTKKPPLDGAAAVITGWGTLDNLSGTLPLQLRKADVNIIRRTRCASKEFGYGSRIKSSMICAGAPGRDACHSDSGGPLVSDGLLVGIVSFGEDCGVDIYPGVYSEVTYFESWLTDTIKELESL